MRFSCMSKQLLVLFSGFLLIGVVYFSMFSQLPMPQGSYAVGVKTIYLVDHARQEEHELDLQKARELMALVYYPADKVIDRQPLMYARHYFISKQQLQYWADVIFKIVLSFVRTHVYQDVPVLQSEKTYPLVIFSHGLTGNPAGNLLYYQELVSRGYIVIAPYHTYGCDVVKFPDGREVCSTIKLDGVAYQKKEAIRTFEQRIWQQDISFIIDYLAAQNQQPSWFLFNKINFDQIGTAGHSFGGSTAIQAARRDKRVKVAVNLDGGLFGDDYLQPFAKPVLCLSNDEGPDLATDEQLKKRGYPSRSEWEQMQTRLVGSDAFNKFIAQQPEGSRTIVIKHAHHQTFTDVAVIGSQYRLLRLLWSKHCSVEQATAFNESLSLMVDFFEKQLKK